MKLVFLYLAIINALGFVVMLVDKHRARKNLWRIPEARLMGIALLGGSVGVLTGMHLARHKTMHLKFTLGVPVILAVQIVTAVLVFSYTA